uniref:WD_REPEATS_REGION domain-containing protein n=1 Tax=Heligmosomoides polygyrus TaxID=6339 RepID=A0A183F8R0_HELPZ
LVNKTIASQNDEWNERRFEFLVGETFIRSSLAEFIEEYNVETETVIKIDGEIMVIDKKGKPLLQNSRDKGSAFKCSVLLQSGSDSKKLEGHQVAAGGEKQVITLFEVTDGVLVPKTVFRGHERSVECVDVNKDCSRLVSGAFDSNIKVPMVTLAGHKDAVVGLKWTTWNSSQVVSASWDHSIAVWDLQLAGEVSRIRASKAFTSIDVNSKSGLVISSSTDAVPRLYDARSHEGSVVKQSFTGHTGWVSCVRWNPCDERCFVSSSFDKSVKMWDIR